MRLSVIARHTEIGIFPFLRRTVAAQTHLAACLASIVGTVILVEKCARHSSPNHIYSALIFGASAVFLFATSSVYHFLYDGFQISNALENWFENLDHIAIYLLIAGTYTPVLLNAVANPWADFLLIFVWSIAFLGVLYTLFRDRFPKWAQHRLVYTGLFLLMGWIFFLRIGEIIQSLSNAGLWYFALAGVSYTLGALIYAVRRPNLIKNFFGFHELWHILVVVGFGFHYFLILSFY
jgi:hemolysin III